MKEAVLISFNFTAGENRMRTKFFKGLYGWKQTVTKNSKRYEYERPGVMDEIPFMKAGNSVVIISSGNLSRLMEYFDEWSESIEAKFFKVLLPEKHFNKINDNNIRGSVDIEVI